MQVNNLAKVVNFITACIFEPNANDLLNSSYGKELFCAIGQDVEELLKYKANDDAKRQLAFQEYLQEAHELGLDID